MEKEELLQLQIQYKQSFEKMMMKMVDFSVVDKMLQGIGFSVPSTTEKEYCFQYKYSTLNSQFVFLRNNIHVEKLSEEEIHHMNICSLDNRDLSDDFLLKTFQKILFEEGGYTYFGVPKDDTLAPSKSIVLSFAYDDKQCDIKQGKAIRGVFDNAYQILSNPLNSGFNVPISKLIDRGFSLNHEVNEDIKIGNLLN